jgi:hypothetical protein
VKMPPIKLIPCIRCDSLDTRLAFDREGHLWFGCLACKYAGPLKLKNGTWLTISTVGIELSEGGESAGGVPSPSIN